MSFSSVKISNPSSSLKPGRSMSNGRLLGSATSLILGLGLVYTSIFYIPAFFDFRGAIGVSANSHSLAETGKKSSLFQPFISLLKQDRTFLTAGQGIDVKYNFPSGTKSELIFYKCQSQIILEVFKCNPIIVERLSVGRRASQKSLRVNSNGFYAIEVVTNSEPGTYQVAWQRRY